MTKTGAYTIKSDERQTLTALGMAQSWCPGPKSEPWATPFLRLSRECFGPISAMPMA